jgi:hypothetical protein
MPEPLDSPGAAGGGSGAASSDCPTGSGSTGAAVSSGGAGSSIAASCRTGRDAVDVRVRVRWGAGIVGTEGDGTAARCTEGRDGGLSSVRSLASDRRCGLPVPSPSMTPLGAAGETTWVSS